MKNKKILIFGLIGLFAVIAIIIVIWQLNQKNQATQTGINQAASFKADYLTSTEKQALNLVTDLPIQAVTRNSQGEVMVYKIIKKDGDVVDPAKVGPISPRTPRP